MLSIRTVAFLEEWAHASDLAYPEGGFLFRYEYAYKQAHCRLKEHVLNALRGDDVWPHLRIAKNSISDLARFYQGALGDYTKDIATGHSILAASTLLSYLQEDLLPDIVELVVQDGSYGMTATFEMAGRARNDYAFLELFWSVD